MGASNSGGSVNKGVAAVLALGVLVLGASFVSSPALAKKNPCTKSTGCPAQIRSEFKACKAACAKDKACKHECVSEKSAQKKACRTATNPTPPSCGFTDEESPSGAFLDLYTE